MEKKRKVKQKKVDKSKKNVEGKNEYWENYWPLPFEITANDVNCSYYVIGLQHTNKISLYSLCVYSYTANIMRFLCQFCLFSFLSIIILISFFAVFYFILLLVFLNIFFCFFRSFSVSNSLIHFCLVAIRHCHMIDLFSDSLSLVH